METLSTVLHTEEVENREQPGHQLVMAGPLQHQDLPLLTQEAVRIPGRHL